MSAYSDLILGTSGILAYWRLGDASGDAIDAAGSLDGTVTGATRGVTGAILGDADTAYSFDGNDGILISNNALLQLSTGTLEFWCKGTTNDGWIVAKHNAWGIALVGSDLGFFDFGGAAVRDSNASVTSGNWHHVVLTFQSGVVGGTIIYRDGVSVLATDMTVSNQSIGISIGADHNGATFESFYTGAIDEVAIYSSILTPTQVAAHYDMGVNGPPATGNRYNIFQLRPIGA
jgi:hypothetical protein